MADSSAMRAQLITTLRDRGALHDAAVARAFQRVPRELFLPGVELDRVYADEAIVTKEEDGVGVSSSSQPAIMAIMLEQLDLFPGARVLEIGAGTGYNAALLRELAGERGAIVTIDIDPEVAGWARERLDRAGYQDVDVRCADGADGWPDAAPYDRIELTVGVADIAPAWIEQLRDGGVLVLPLLVRSSQAVIAFEKRDDHLVSRSIQAGGFMRVRGKLPDPRQQMVIASGITVAAGRGPLPRVRIERLLATEPLHEPWAGNPWDGFYFYADLWGLPTLSFWSNDPAASFQGGGFGALDASDMSLAIVAAAPARDGEFDLLAWGGRASADALKRAHARWNALGQPTIRQLRVTAWPTRLAPDPESGDIVVDTQWWRLIFAM